MGVKLVGGLTEERNTEIMRSGVGYVIFKGAFVDFYLRCCGFVCLFVTVTLSCQADSLW